MTVDRSNNSYNLKLIKTVVPIKYYLDEYILEV